MGVNFIYDVLPIVCQVLCQRPVVFRILLDSFRIELRVFSDEFLKADFPRAVVRPHLNAHAHYELCQPQRVIISSSAFLELRVNQEMYIRWFLLRHLGTSGLRCSDLKLQHASPSYAQSLQALIHLLI